MLGWGNNKIRIKKLTMNFDNEKKPDIAKTRGKWWDPSPETVPVVPIDQMANTISGIKK